MDRCNYLEDVATRDDILNEKCEMASLRGSVTPQLCMLGSVSLCCGKCQLFYEPINELPPKGVIYFLRVADPDEATGGTEAGGWALGLDIRFGVPGDNWKVSGRF